MIRWLCVRILLAMACSVVSTNSATAQSAATERTVDERGDGYNLTVTYPQFGLSSADVPMQEWASQVLVRFKSVLADRDVAGPPYSDELTYDVVRDDDSALSIVFTDTSYLGGAHGNVVKTTFNFLKPDGVRVYLPDLIGYDGLTRVSDVAIADLTGRLQMSDAASILIGAGPYADNFETFEWLPDELVLEFNPYEVAGYAAGPQQVRIPMSRLADVVRPDPRVPLPSFTCGAATTVIENVICADMTLAQLDRRTAEAFNRRLRLEALGHRLPTVRSEQQAWLGQRDTCADGADDSLRGCLQEQYTLRLAALRNGD